MIMTLVHALLQPNFSLSHINQYSNAIKINSYLHYDIGYDDSKTEITLFDNSSIDTYEENINTQIDTDVPNKQLSTIKTSNNNIIEAENYNVSIKFTKINIRCLYTISTNRLKTNYKKKQKQSNAHGRNKIYGIKYNLIITFNKHLVHIVYNNYNRTLICIINKINNNRINNGLNIMNIKHLKLFKILNNLNIKYLDVYLHKQSIITDNLNIYIKENIYSRNKITIYNSFNMPYIEEVTEICIKLPVDIYNILVLKAADMTFNESGWHRLEQLLNILCNTNGNPNGFDIVWWNMQTCWTSFRKNSNGKWTNEFTVNCEIISADEEEIIIVYIIMDDK
jgi:hypothetical protein